MTQDHIDTPAGPAAPLPGGVRPDPTKIVVPRRHGQVLCEPALKTLEAALGEDGRAGFFEGAAFAGIPVEVLRRKARRQMLGAAVAWAERTGMEAPAEDVLEKPWVVTGHQVEFYHAGVWAKVLAASVLAKRTGNVAFDLLVDHDVVDERGFDIPKREGDQWKRVSATWAAASPVPAEAMTAPASAAFEKWDAAVAKSPEAATDTMAFVLAALKPDGKEGAYPPWLSKARARLEAAMCVDVHHVPTSSLCTGEAWEIFVRAWAEHAGEWIPIYNKHLAAYRGRQGIKNPQHPMPDLGNGEEGLELPFWIYRLGEPRQRVVVKKDGDGEAVVHVGGRDISLEGCLRGETGLVIRPRALALTMYVRLFLADLFIHGIGGALYDQITDGILAELVGVVPSYACVSAAWLLPLGQPLENQDDLSALAWRRHHLAHNPQLAIDPFTALRADVAELILERRLLIDGLRESLKTSRNDGNARRQRSESFRQLHAVNALLHKKTPRVLENLDEQLRQTITAREQNKVLLWREYFFALHSMESLGKLIEAVEGK